MFTQPQMILRDLGSGLIMRHAIREDVDALCELNTRTLGDDAADRKGVVAWTRDLLTRPHATFQTSDFIIVEEPLTGRIVSSMCMIPQIWSYEGIEFGVSRPELAGTLPEFRGRGLIYALDAELGLKPGITKDQLLKAMRGHILAEAQLMGTYRR